MVRWGGPRFEFYFTRDFLNHEYLIKKEEAQRAAFIHSKREHERAKEDARFAEAEQKKAQLQEEAQRLMSAEVEEAARRAAAEAAAQNTAHARRLRRLKELAVPVIRGSSAHSAGSHGCVMYPTPKGVPLPMGRDRAPYTPGVDRHRIVPPPPEPGAHKPWQGSGTAWMADKNNDWQKQYYFTKSKRPAETLRERRACIDKMERCHTNAGAAKKPPVNQDESPANDQREIPTFGTERQHDEMGSESESERPLSIFSHGSSNAPIRALGTQHMGDISTKEEVREFLRRYPTGVVPPRDRRAAPPNFNGMNLTELTSSLIKMQKCNLCGGHP